MLFKRQQSGFGICYELAKDAFHFRIVGEPEGDPHPQNAVPQPNGFVLEPHRSLPQKGHWSLLAGCNGESLMSD
jgi:hypothetical protein